MRKLGLIGGTGPESTLIYYKTIVYGANKIVGEKFFPNINIESLNVFDVLNFCAEKNYDGLADYLMNGIRNLEAAGCNLISLTGNTAHIVFDTLRSQSSVPLVSIIETVEKKAHELGFKKVGLLGTRFTMEEEFFKKPFREAEIEIFSPTGKDLDFIAEKISCELEHGIIKEETKKGFLDVIQNMISDYNIEAIILGCTELPLLFGDMQLTIPCLDTLKIHADALLTAMELKILPL